MADLSDDYLPDLSSDDSQDSVFNKKNVTQNSPELSHLTSRSVKRPASSHDEQTHPFKRRQGPLNHSYLALLNTSIHEAATRFSPPSPSDPELPDSTLGIITWTSQEKLHLFSLLSRIGRDGTPAMARELHTKSPLEIEQYLRLLEDGAAARRDLRPRADLREQLRPVHPADVPAAAEISRSCEEALEDAADAVALITERHEEAYEKERWGGERWLITYAIAKDMAARRPREDEDGMEAPMRGRRQQGWVSQDGQEYEDRRPTEESTEDEGFTVLFNLPAWLRLSERVFMNGGTNSDANWRLVSDEPPAIRATALEDFHTLAVSLTKRLAAASLTIAEQRVRSMRHVVSETKALVRPQDVIAAVASLGLKKNSHRFWMEAPRRLRLDIVEVEPRAGEKAEAMELKDVELQLGYDASDTEAEGAESSDGEVSQLGEEEEVCPNEDQNVKQEEVMQDAWEERGDPTRPTDGGNVTEATKMAHSENYNDDDDDDDESIRSEFNEIIRYSAMDYPITTRSLDVLRLRIRAERERERLADEFDLEASRREETRLWAMLNLDQFGGSDTTNDDGDETGEVGTTDKQKSKRSTLAVEDVYPHASNWRENVRYVAEWESKNRDD